MIVDDDAMAFSAIQEVGPGGHFFGAQHTLQRYETAFYQPLVSDWRNFETWREAGSPDAATHANRIWKRVFWVRIHRSDRGSMGSAQRIPAAFRRLQREVGLLRA